ncbi:MAG: response regulator [Desulfobacula sp.]|jgi:two-component system, cell cycle response regulator DivK|nr:response regulator [Desulfobacula sp.]MBT6339671.1 response regulator [Desulfobacula sp.]MBT7261010.1 response regulator [Desulfobacula sp.]
MAGEKILIVEDNRMNMELANDLLEIAGFTALQADTAEKGVSLAREQLPNLILMDISLPGMDGLEAAKLIRGDERTRDIPIVAMTAHAMKGDEEKATLAGCNGYITKPLDIKLFSNIVKGFLNKKDR